MKSATILTALFALNICSAVLVRAADTFKIDPMHSTVGFSVKHMVINNIKGKFTDFNGTVVIDNNALQEAKGTIQSKSVDTGIAQRDNDLRSANFFDATKYPTISFVSKRAEKQGNQTVLVGDFAMHGVTKELSLPVNLSGPIQDPWGNMRVGLEATTKLNRKDYGLMYNKALETGGLVVGDEITIEINAEAVKAK